MSKSPLRFVLSGVLLAFCAASWAQSQPATAAGAAAAENKPEVAWYPDWQAAFDASAKSGKPIFMFVYLPRDKACIEMTRTTLMDADVVKALSGFETCAVSTRDKASRGILEQYRTGAVKGKQGNSLLQLVPVALFIGPDRAEYYRQIGFLPPPVFEVQVQRIVRLMNGFAALRANPQDACASAQIGHAYLELDRYDVGKEYLNQAIANDPENKQGAFADAKLDLTILAISDDARKAIGDLTDYLATYPGSARRLEVRYYMAVAQIAAGNNKLAEKMLAEFETSDPNAPEAKSEWGNRARKLLAELRKANGGK